MQIQRRSELVLATHWTFDELNQQDRREVKRLEVYLEMKHAIEKQRVAMDKGKRP